MHYAFVVLIAERRRCLRSTLNIHLNVWDSLGFSFSKSWRLCCQFFFLLSCKPVSKKLHWWLVAQCRVAVSGCRVPRYIQSSSQSSPPVSHNAAHAPARSWNCWTRFRSGHCPSSCLYGSSSKPCRTPSAFLERRGWHTDETTSHPTKQPKNGCQVVGYGRLDLSGASGLPLVSFLPRVHRVYAGCGVAKFHTVARWNLTLGEQGWYPHDNTSYSGDCRHGE